MAIIINADTMNRDYSISGTDIMVKIFDNHYVVESPGILPVMVRIDNIRQMHFWRNPNIVDFMREYKLVQGFGGGVDRMLCEMSEAGNPAPDYKQVEFMVKVRLNSSLREDSEKKGAQEITQKNVQPGESTGDVANNGVKSAQKSTQKSTQRIIALIKDNPYITTQEIADQIGIIRRGVAKHIKKLQEKGIIRRVGPEKGGHWEVIVPGERGEMQ